MKVSINKIIARKLSKRENIFLPKIGYMHFNKNQLCFTYAINDTFKQSIIDTICEEYNISKDVAYQRYEYWRHAITTQGDSHYIIHIEGVIWIIVDSNNDYFYQYEIK